MRAFVLVVLVGVILGACESVAQQLFGRVGTGSTTRSGSR